MVHSPNLNHKVTFFFKFHLRDHKVLNYIFQNSIVIIISQFPWLLSAVGTKSSKTFLISYCLQKHVIFKFRFKPPEAPSLLVPPCFPRNFFVRVVVCDSTKAAVHSVNTVHWLVAVRQELNFCMFYVVRY
jgi:hypothetical protein